MTAAEICLSVAHLSAHGKDGSLSLCELFYYSVRSKRVIPLSSRIVSLSAAASSIWMSSAIKGGKSSCI